MADIVETSVQLAHDIDDAWQAELVACFGEKRAADERYTSRGRGVEGSDLRRLHDMKIAADNLLRVAFGMRAA